MTANRRWTARHHGRTEPRTARARAEMEELETGLLQMARGRGMTWPEIAFGLGLASPQAARQRYERLAERTDPGRD